MTFSYLRTNRKGYFFEKLPSTLQKVRQPLNLMGPNGLIFSILDQDSGYSKLSTSITLNGQTQTAMFAYRGHEATTSSWTAYVGTDMSINGAGADVEPGRYTPFTTTDETSVNITTFNSKYYHAPNDSYAQIGTNDFVFEAVVRVTGSSSRAFFSKYTTLGPHGYLFGLNTLRPSVWLTVSGTGGGFNTSTTLTDRSWNHIMAFGDRSGNLRFYINGVYDTEISIAAVETGSVNLGTQRFQIGTFSNNTNTSGGEFAWLAAWQGTDLCGGLTGEQDNLAAERFSKLTGFFATYAIDQAFPSSQTRATIANLDRYINQATGERQMFLVGTNWMRLCQRKEKTGGEYYTGFLCENSATNLFLRSQEFNLTWNTGSVTGSVTVIPNVIQAPNGEIVADAIVADTNNARHCVGQGRTLSNSTHTLSVFAKPGNNNWIALQNASIISGTAWFDISNGIVGSFESNITGTRIDNWGNGWYRCSMSFPGSNPSTTLNILTCQADGNINFAGDGSTINTYLFGAQVENAASASSYVPTAGSAVGRNNEILRYTGSANFPPSDGTLEIKSLTRQNRANGYLLYLTVTPPSNNNRISFMLTNPDKIQMQGNTAGIIRWNPITGSNLDDGEIHTFKQTFTQGSVKCYIDGNQVFTNNTSIMLTGSSLLVVGSDTSNCANTLISNIKIYDNIQ